MKHILTLFIGLVAFVESTNSLIAADNNKRLYLICTSVDAETANKKRRGNDFNFSANQFLKVFLENKSDYFSSIETYPLLGANANRSSIVETLNTIKSKASKNDFVVFYLDSHGETDSKEGWSALMPNSEDLRGKELKMLLGRFPCQVLCLIETCTSGGFAHTHKDDIPLPENVTAICCCKENQVASNQLDIACMEALHGWADFHDQKEVNLHQLVKYVRIRYNQSFANRKGDNKNNAVIVKSKEFPAIPLTKTSANRIAFVDQNHWFSGIYIKQYNKGYHVEAEGYDSTHTNSEWFEKNCIAKDKVVFPDLEIPVSVNLNGKTAPAKITEIRPKSYVVSLINTGKTMEVEKDRIQFPPFVYPKASKEYQNTE
jgi:Caspase domain